MHHLHVDETEAEELAAQAREQQRQQNQRRRHYNPRDPDYIDWPTHQYTGQQPLDLD